MVEMPEGWPVAIVDGEERALVHPAVRAGHVYAGTGRARGRWSPAPSPRSLVANGTAEPGWRGRVEADRAGQWVCRWRDGATRRNNYLLFGGAPGDAAAATFDAAARFGDALADVRAALIRDARRRGPVQRLAVHSLLVDLARFLPDDDCCATAVWSADFRGDRGLKRTLGTLRGASPPEGEVDAYLGSLVPGLHGRALWLFHAVQHALPEVAALEALARKRRLPPGDALRLMVGFRVGMPDDPLLAVSKSLGYPEGLFRTRAGKVHLASGLMGKLAAALLCSFPADLPLGPASLFADALGRMGVDLGKAAAAAQRASEAALVRQGLSKGSLVRRLLQQEDEPIAVCRAADHLVIDLRAEVGPEEHEANEWFWQQSRRPTSKESSDLRFLLRQVAVPRSAVEEPRGATLRAASKLHRRLA